MLRLRTQSLSLGRENHKGKPLTSGRTSVFLLPQSRFWAAVAEGQRDELRYSFCLNPTALKSSEHSDGAQEGPVGWEQSYRLEGLLLL